MSVDFLLQSSHDQVTVFPELDFTKYIHFCQELIINNRVDLTLENKEILLNANSPFEYKPSRASHHPKGILLVHGLFDSPLIMQDLATYFHKKNFWVRSILLPGHGTRPGDLLTTSYRQWLTATRYGLTSLQNCTSKIYLAGFSTGALLGMYHALSGVKIDGLILLSPGLTARTKLINSSLFLHKMAKVIPQLQWLYLGKNQDYARYESFPLHAIYQFYLLTQATARLYQDNHLDIPIFMVVSEDDYVVNAKAAMNWFVKQLHPANQLIVYGNKNNPTYHKQIKYIRSAHLHLKIKNFSHLCIPISPENKHYGIDGDYENFQAITERQHSKYHSVGSKKKYLSINKKMLNLSYNPDFFGLLKELDLFFDQIS